MRFVIQCVEKASVCVDEKTVGQIDRGLMVLCGISNDDTEAVADRMIKKMCCLRIFKDAEGKTNLSVTDIGGQILMVSQFTLYASCKEGNRPGFSNAGKPEMAEKLYNYILKQTAMTMGSVQQGVFGADMKVSLVNDGPFTIFLDSKEMGWN